MIVLEFIDLLNISTSIKIEKYKIKNNYCASLKKNVYVQLKNLMILKKKIKPHEIWCFYFMKLNHSEKSSRVFKFLRLQIENFIGINIFLVPTF